jgi:CRISPR-associated endonuclease Csy4
MSHYLDIRVLPDPEMSASQVLSALYGKLHGVLVAMRSVDVGVSFPGYAVKPPTLGTVLRLLGPVAQLEAVLRSTWLGGVRDHVAVGPVTPVPAGVAHRALRRVQTKSNPDRLRRRQMKRHGLTEAEARERIPDEFGKTLTLPFVFVFSASTGQRFCLFLSLGDAAQTGQAGTFNAYGLSATATIPWF